MRFESAVAALAPELTSIAPIRDLALTRDKAILYAEEHGLPIKQSKKNPYSVDKKRVGPNGGDGAIGRPLGGTA